MVDIFETAVITTDRLQLIPFAPAHAAALNAINNEPQVMEFLSSGDPEPLSKTEQTITRVREKWERLGYSWWAICERGSGRIVGAACLQHVANDADAELEIGWRLSTATTGKGYATEAGKAAADYAFDAIGADHIIAVAHPDNIASHKVMQRVGMQYRGQETHYDADCTTYVMHRFDRS